MGEALVSRRGGEKSGQFAYETKKYQYVITHYTTTNPGIVAIGSAYAGSSIATINPSTGVVTLENSVYVGTATTAEQVNQLLGKYVTTLGESYFTCLYIGSAEVYDPVYGRIKITDGYRYQSTLLRTKITISDSALYPSDTLVGDEYRKNL